MDTKEASILAVQNMLLREGVLARGDRLVVVTEQTLEAACWANIDMRSNIDFPNLAMANIGKKLVLQGGSDIGSGARLVEIAIKQGDPGKLQEMILEVLDEIRSSRRQLPVDDETRFFEDVAHLIFTEYQPGDYVFSELDIHPTTRLFCRPISDPEQFDELLNRMYLFREEPDEDEVVDPDDRMYWAFGDKFCDKNAPINKPQVWTINRSEAVGKFRDILERARPNSVCPKSFMMWVKSDPVLLEIFEDSPLLEMIKG